MKNTKEIFRSTASKFLLIGASSFIFDLEYNYKSIETMNQRLFHILEKKFSFF